MNFSTKIHIFILINVASTWSNCVMGGWKEDWNRKFVLEYFNELFVKKNVDSVDNFLVPEYIQHNPGLPDGRDALKKAAREWFTLPWTTQVLRVAAMDDMVWLHTRTESELLFKLLGGNGTVAAVDIYRLCEGKIVEHWDVIQILPPHSANSHPLF